MWLYDYDQGYIFEIRKMALDVKELCRLCGKKDEFSKDLKDEDNKNVLKMIQEFIRIPFAEHDELPTKVCLNCEEKIESFQLFIVECYNVQETLRQMCLETCEKHPIKVEDDIVMDYNISTIKSEVDELSAENLVNAINSDECMTGFDADDYNNDNNDNDMSNVTLATLKDLKQEKTSERNITTLPELGKKHFKEISDLNTGDLVDCDKCPRITKTLPAMNKDKMMHMSKSKTKFCCSSCDKVFTCKKALRVHMRTHIPIEERKIYSCDLCEKKFTTRWQTAVHRRAVHDKIKRHACELCAYTCGTSAQLRRHSAIHSNDRPFACRTCNKRFKTYVNLKTHMEIHGATSHVCPVCSRVFKSRRVMREHLIVHYDERPHVCSHCNKAFKRRQTLKEHMNSHTDDKPVTCKWCDERFKYNSQLRTHRLRHHPDKIAEAQCTTHVSVPEGYLKNDAVLPKTDVETV